MSSIIGQMAQIKAEKKEKLIQAKIKLADTDVKLDNIKYGSLDSFRELTNQRQILINKIKQLEGVK